METFTRCTIRYSSVMAGAVFAAATAVIATPGRFGKDKHDETLLCRMFSYCRPWRPRKARTVNAEPLPLPWPCPPLCEHQPPVTSPKHVQYRQCTHDYWNRCCAYVSFENVSFLQQHPKPQMNSFKISRSFENDVWSSLTSPFSLRRLSHSKGDRTVEVFSTSATDTDSRKKTLLSSSQVLQGHSR